MGFVSGIGRAIFGGFFLQSGINHLQHADALAGYAAAKQLPSPKGSVQLSGALLIASGISLVLGLKPRLGALGVAGFLVAATPTFHDFWNDQDPGAKQNNTIHFSKNIALLGAAVALAGISAADRD